MRVTPMAMSWCRAGSSRCGAQGGGSGRRSVSGGRPGSGSEGHCSEEHGRDEHADAVARAVVSSAARATGARGRCRSSYPTDGLDLWRGLLAPRIRVGPDTQFTRLVSDRKPSPRKTANADTVSQSRVSDPSRSVRGYQDMPA
jgi:hypothetical protein